ncbi:hypothetical protein [Halorubellus litoreus]|uniref:Uncharacterized protein n=1 Tax=Halorubellus litoreus TaxID=755308 RepID=A0ABD5V801_9EURY
MTSDSPSPLGLAALWLAATAALCAPLALAATAPPTDAISLPFESLTTPALAVLAATVGVVTLAVVIGVARAGTSTDRWGNRVATAAVVAVVSSFLAAATLTPPDPLTQLVVGVPLVGVALLAAHAAVAFGVDERVRALT